MSSVVLLWCINNQQRRSKHNVKEDFANLENICEIRSIEMLELNMIVIIVYRLP